MYVKNKNCNQNIYNDYCWLDKTHFLTFYKYIVQISTMNIIFYNQNVLYMLFKESFVLTLKR